MKKFVLRWWQLAVSIASGLYVWIKVAQSNVFHPFLMFFLVALPFVPIAGGLIRAMWNESQERGAGDNDRLYHATSRQALSTMICSKMLYGRADGRVYLAPRPDMQRLANRQRKGEEAMLVLVDREPGEHIDDVAPIRSLPLLYGWDRVKQLRGEWRTTVQGDLQLDVFWISLNQSEAWAYWKPIKHLGCIKKLARLRRLGVVVGLNFYVLVMLLTALVAIFLEPGSSTHSGLTGKAWFGISLLSLAILGLIFWYRYQNEFDVWARKEGSSCSLCTIIRKGTEFVLNDLRDLLKWRPQI